MGKGNLYGVLLVSLAGGAMLPCVAAASPIASDDVLQLQQVDVSYESFGGLEPNVQVPWLFDLTTTRTTDVPSRSPFVGTSWSLLETRRGVSVVFSPQAEIDMDGVGVLARRSELTAPLGLSLDVGALTLEPQLGPILAAGTRQWTYGMTVSRALRPTLELGAQLSMVADAALRSHDRFANVQLAWKPREHFAIVGAAGTGLSASRTSALLAYLAVRVTL